MFIDGPTFVHRKIMNTRGEVASDDPSYKFGTQRNLLIKYVTSALSKHEKDQEILEKFRREADERKRRKFESKRKTSAIDPALTKKNTNENLPPIASANVAARNQQQKSRDLSSHKNSSEYLATRHQRDLENVLQHQSDLVEKYRKLLTVKEKELKQKNKRLGRNKYALEKMSQKIKYLQKEQYLQKKEEEVQLTHMQNILKQLSNQLVQNKSTFQHQITRMRRQSRPIWEPNVSSDYSSKQPDIMPQNQSQKFKKPTMNQLQLIKRKAKSLKNENEVRIIRSPTVQYTKIPTEESNEIDSPRRGNYLSQLNKSIIKQSKFRHMVGQEQQKSAK